MIRFINVYLDIVESSDGIYRYHLIELHLDSLMIDLTDVFHQLLFVEADEWWVFKKYIHRHS